MTRPAPRAAASWTFLSPGPDVLVAVRERPRGLAADLARVPIGRIFLTGDLSAVGAADVIQLAAATKCTGLLLMSSARAERALLLVAGRVAWATSTELPERRHERLCRFDLVERCSASAPPNGGSPAGLREQAIAVLAGALAEHEGMFTLSAVPPLPVAPASCLDVPELLVQAALAAFDAEG